MLYTIDTPGQDIQPTSSAAIATLAIGDAFQDVWHRVARPSWEVYAQRHGMDIIAVGEPLDPSDRAARRSPAWQKCLVLSQVWSRRYERIVWLDADIVINTEAPSILDSCGTPPLVSATLIGDHLSAAEKHLLMERINNVVIAPDDAERQWSKFQNWVYTSHGVATELTDMVATGVMVLSPAHHRAMFEQVYRLADHGGRAYEQPGLSHQILTRQWLHRVSARFNWGLYEQNWLSRRGRWDEPDDENFTFISAELKKAYFLHFYMALEAMRGLVVAR
jgi:hypothetical protein